MISKTLFKLEHLNNLFIGKLDEILLRDLQPMILCLDLTYKCDSNCENCIEKKARTNNLEANFREVEKLITYASRHMRGIEIAGGEPMGLFMISRMEMQYILMFCPRLKGYPERLKLLYHLYLGQI